MLGPKGFVLCLCAAFWPVLAGMAQIRRAPGAQADTKVDISITLKRTGQAYEFSGKGECTYAPVAFIYGIRAQLWRVEQNSSSGSVILTFWRPADGSGDMFTIDMSVGGKSDLVSTVNKGGASAQGSGKMGFTSSGAGGTFTIDAKATNGANIAGTIKCSAFRPATAEGG